jgi:hypothetical protein
LNGYLYAGVKAGYFTQPGNAWVNLRDPISSQVPAAGSVWPVVGQAFVTARGTPIGFVPAAVNGTLIAHWAPGTANYTAMVARALAAGPTLKAVLWWQGEFDALFSTSQVTYHAALSTMAAQIAIDLGVPLVACKIQWSGALATKANTNVINAAIAQAWADVPNVRQGPDLSDLVAEDGYHLVNDATVQEAGARWWAALVAAGF